MTYLDGDLYFFASPEPIYGELARCRRSAIIPHRYAPNIGRLQRFGTYNVGWVGARNDARRHCRDHNGGGKDASNGATIMSMASALPTRAISTRFRDCSPRVKAIDEHRRQPRALEYRQLPDRSSATARCMIDDVSPLLFFHFQGLRKGLRWFFFTSHRAFRAPFSAVDAQSHLQALCRRIARRSKRPSSRCCRSRRRSRTGVRRSPTSGNSPRAAARSRAPACSSCWISPAGARCWSSAARVTSAADREQLGLRDRAMAGHSEDIVGDARPFADEAQPGLAAESTAVPACRNTTSTTGAP